MRGQAQGGALGRGLQCPEVQRIAAWDTPGRENAQLSLFGSSITQGSTLTPSGAAELPGGKALGSAPGRDRQQLPEGQAQGGGSGGAQLPDGAFQGDQPPGGRPVLSL